MFDVRRSCSFTRARLLIAEAASLIEHQKFGAVLVIWIFHFEFVSDFDIRISDFICSF